MSWWKRSVTIATAVALLAACADASEKKVAKTSSPKHVSPAPVPVPLMPAGTFDHAKEANELAAARTARASGDNLRAHGMAEAAVNHWPGDIAAWAELQAANQALGDDPGQRYADFFHNKIEYVNPLPARVAVLGFQNIAEQPPGTTAGGYVFDQRTIAMARRLEAFYNSLDPVVAQRNAPAEPSFGDKYPYLDELGVGAVVAGVLTVAKSAANK